MDVSYQRALTASKTTASVPTRYYDLPLAREIYYDMQADHISEKNAGMDKNEICKAISHVKSKNEEEHERNIEYMVQGDYYKSPWKIKYATVATGLKTVTCLSDSDEKPAAKKEPIKGSRLGKRVCHSEDGSTNMDPIVTGFSIIGQIGYRDISG